MCNARIRNQSVGSRHGCARPRDDQSDTTVYTLGDRSRRHGRPLRFDLYQIIQLADKRIHNFQDTMRALQDRAAGQTRIVLTHSMYTGRE